MIDVKEIQTISVKEGDTLVFRFDPPWPQKISPIDQRVLFDFFSLQKKVSVIFTDATEIYRLTREDAQEIDIRSRSQEWRQGLYERLHKEFGCKMWR